MLIDTIQFKNGKAVERFLDDYFAAKYNIRPTTKHEEQILCLGDRLFTQPNGHSFYIEYKSGIQTFYTGNVFLETISVDTPCKAGWVYTCQAKYVFYAALLNHKILIFRPEKLRGHIASLKDKFKEAKTGKGQNEGYNTHGVLVPLDYAEKYLADKVIAL